MRMSIVMRSGRRSTAFSTASSPSDAVATTDTSGSLVRILTSSSRIVGESSTTRTRIIVVVVLPRVRGSEQGGEGVEESALFEVALDYVSVRADPHPAPLVVVGRERG